jgi:hypothetical protein
LDLPPIIQDERWWWTLLLRAHWGLLLSRGHTLPCEIRMMGEN